MKTGLNALNWSRLLKLIVLAAGSLALGAVAVSLSAQQTPAGAAAQASQQKARAVLNGMIQALGGEAYMNLQDSESEGRYERFYAGKPGATAVYCRFWEWPDKERIDLTKQRDVIELT